MRGSRSLGRGFLACLAILLTGASVSAHAGYDLVIRSGRIADGTGNPAYFGDLAVKNGRVAAVGRVEGAAPVEIDARGLVVAPGFIDVHTHCENAAERPLATNFLRMGVTTLVTGNCGGSKLDVAEFFKAIEKAPVAINMATLVGHNSVRSSAMGGAFDRAPSSEEMACMKELVEQAMRDGAVGLSTGLIYLPGTFSKTEEIIELAKVAAAHDGIYASHMRNEGTGIRTSIDEVFRISREAHIRAEISHIKLSGKSAWGRAREVLDAIDVARAGGLDVTHDQYVYTASSTGLSTLIPDSAREGGPARFRERIADPEQKAKIVAAMKSRLAARGETGYGYAVVASYRPDESINGKSIPEAAKLKRGSDSLDDQVELVLEIEANGGGSGIFHGMSEEDLQIFLRHPNTMIASDGGIRSDNDGVPHPRSFGNNARVLGRYVRELKILRLEDAIRKMTSLPATTFRLRDRGLLRPGFWADVVVLDPSRVRDDATFGDPYHYAAGIPHVLVNGVPIIRDGAQTEARPGQALRHRASAAVAAGLFRASG